MFGAPSNARGALAAYVRRWQLVMLALISCGVGALAWSILLATTP